MTNATTNWFDFLTTSFGTVKSARPPPDRLGYCGLTNYGLLRVSGDDAVSFLQGQLTCDLTGLAPGTSVLGALCNPKGRVLASFYVLYLPAALYLLLPVEMAEYVRKRLQVYVLRSKVIIEDHSATSGFIGVFGSNTTVLTSPGVYTPSVSENGCYEYDGVLVLQIPPDRSLLTASTERAKKFWKTLQTNSQYSLVNPAAWRLQNIESGIPEILPLTSEQFLPQMLNLDILGGIGFQKGCYTGQEIVARTHYLGQIKRRMLRFSCSETELPSPATPIFDGADASAASIGQIVLAAPQPVGGYQFLAVAASSTVEKGNVRIGSHHGPKGDVLDLPYALKEEQHLKGKQ